MTIAFFFLSERIEVLENTKVPHAFKGTIKVSLNTLNVGNIDFKWKIHILITYT